MDLVALHWALWERTDVAGQVSIDRNELADELGVSRQMVTKVIGQMVAAGKIHRTPGSRGPYFVTSPIESP